ncbi:MAG: DUF3108 domain-containing protein [Capnocytophaga sp.]|nr:DUF3108 domain-containing protein [Capnocytophaga sp.]
MKKQLLLFAIFISNVLIHSLSAQNKDAFQSGEWLRFKVRYGIFNASFATLEVKEDTYNGEKVFHAVGKGSTTGLARVFFRVDDVYESYFSKKDGLPRYFIRNIHEGGYTKHLKVTFDHDKNKAKINNVKNDTITYLATTPGIHDLISGVYALRNRPELDNIQNGQEIGMDMLFDDDELFNFRLKFIGKENVKTSFGTIPTMIFRPLVKDGRVFKEQESLTVWISDDANRVPVKVRASLRVGSLVAELNDFKGLKHPTLLKK